MASISVSLTIALLLVISIAQLTARRLRSDGGPAEYFEGPDLDECENYCEGDCDEIYFEIGHGFRDCEFLESFCDCGINTTLIITVIVCIALGLALLIFSGICCFAAFKALNCDKNKRSYSPLLETNYAALMNEEEATNALQVPSAPPPYGMTGYGSFSSYQDAPPTYADILKGRRNSEERRGAT